MPPTDEIELTLPCCDSSVTLSSIDFGPNVRFARFGIRVEHRTDQLDKRTLKKLGDIFGCPMTQVHVRE